MVQLLGMIASSWGEPMSRAKLEALRQKVVSQAQQTKQVRAEVEAKREERKAVQSVAREPLHLDNEPAKKKVNATQVERWFSDGVKEIYGPTFVVARWTVPQKALAKRLLDEYGADLVEKAVFSYCKGWEAMVKKSRGRLVGAPTLGLFWSMRETVFAEVQVGKRQVAAKNSDEYTDDDGSPDAGW
jgi:hypothetical protein